MFPNTLKCQIIPLIFIIIFAEVRALNRDSLRATHPIYGVSSVIKATLTNASACFRELSEFRSAADSGKVWALKVLDASGRAPAGFLYGNNLWIGSHTQCIDIHNRKKFEIRNDKVNHMETLFDYPPYELSYSVVMLRHNSTMQWQMRLPLDWVVQIGLCVPKSCTKQELFNLSDEYFSSNYLEFQKEYQVNLNVTKVRILKEDFWWILKLSKTIVFIIIIATILLLTVFGTIFDVKEHTREKNFIRGHNREITMILEKDSKEKQCTWYPHPLGHHNGKLQMDELIRCTKQEYFIMWEIKTNSMKLVNNFSSGSLTDSTKYDNGCLKIIKCFSVYSNIKIWNKTKIGTDSLPVIHGLRFLSMGWVVIVHNSFFEGDFTQNAPYAWRLTENFFGQIFSNSTYSVDTYLFLSGFLLAYLFFKHTNPHEAKGKPANCIRKTQQLVFMCIYRFSRLTPTYAILILFCNVIYTSYSKMSSLYYTEQPQDRCDSYWWRNLLYINNLYPRSEMCLSWSWYLSIDTQFFTITSFLLILSTIFFNLSAFLVILLILIQITVTAYKSYSIGYIPTMDDQLEQLDALYDLPWNRIGPYMIGVITAYILEIKLKNKLVLKEKTRLTLWVIFPLVNLWILFALYTRQVSVEFSAFYMGVSRTLWGVGIAWLVVATTTGNARLLEKLLSYKAWVPLSRLTYCAYLLNPLVVTMTSLGSEAAIQVSIPEMAISSAGTLLITFLLSFVFSLLFESPFILLTKLAFKNITEKHHKSNTSQEVIAQNGNLDSFGNATSSISTIT